MTKTFTQGSINRGSVKKDLKLRYWAVRLGDLVELRVWSKRPVKVTSSLTKKIVKDSWEYKCLPNGSFEQKKVQRESKFVLKQVVYIGGKPLGVVKARDIAYDLKVPVDGRVEIDKKTKDSLLRRFPHW